MQRLFSTFAGGWPGVGLLLQRCLTALLLFRLAIIHIAGRGYSSAFLPEAFAACAGILLLVGLWTPVVGTLIAIFELWVALAHVGDPWIALVLATFGCTAAMIGPGEWSVDARLFGRRHLLT
ncbi:MAG: hypothetical protein JO065_13595 [Acidobacteria bacterium]|nr:hypothetical protein [Acidobacteriota bacterium]MBV9434683.1 hypothetical protein [Acidobacteriota bacterium]